MSFLPGWFPGAAAAAAALTELTQVDSATDNSGAAFTLPDDIQAGDLIAVWDYAAGTSLPADATPSGFDTAITVTDGTNVRGKLHYKIADGSEASASVNGLDGNTREGKLTYVFRGNIPITVATPADAASQITGSDPTAQVVNASGGQAPLIVFGCYVVGSGGTVDPRTFSTTKDGEIQVTGAGGGDIWLAYKIYNSAPADTTIDMADEGAGNVLASCYIECS